jgi:DNA primase
MQGRSAPPDGDKSPWTLRTEPCWVICGTAIERHSVRDRASTIQTIFIRTDVLVECRMGRPPGPWRNGKRTWQSPGDCYESGLAGSTRLLTSAGLRAVDELTEGEPIQVLGSTGEWVSATTHAVAACRRMRELVVERNQVAHVLRAAAGQLWPVNSAARRLNGRPPLPFRTDGLKAVLGSASWKLVTVNPQVTVSIDDTAALHGVVFGDGTYYRSAQRAGRRPSCHVYLCNDRKGCDSRRLAPLFERAGFRPVIRDDHQQVRFYGLPAHWKCLPSLDAGPKYLRGFIAGWFAADGHVDARAPVALLSSANREHLEWLQRIAPIAGLAVSTSIGLRQSNSTFGPSTWYSLGIAASTLDEHFFLSPEKRARYRPAHFAKQWKIVAVRCINASQRVYRVLAEGGQCVIEGNILITCERLKQVG